MDLHFEGKDNLIGGKVEGKRSAFRLFWMRSELTTEMWGFGTGICYSGNTSLGWWGSKRVLDLLFQLLDSYMNGIE